MAEIAEIPEWKRRKIEALEQAKEIEPCEYAGGFSPPNDLAVTLALVAGGYGFTITNNGEVCALVAGDHGYAATDIVLDKDTIAYWRDDAVARAILAERERAAKVCEAYGSDVDPDLGDWLASRIRNPLTNTEETK